MVEKLTLSLFNIDSPRKEALTRFLAGFKGARELKGSEMHGVMGIYAQEVRDLRGIQLIAVFDHAVTDKGRVAKQMKLIKQESLPEWVDRMRVGEIMPLPVNYLEIFRQMNMRFVHVA